MLKNTISERKNVIASAIEWTKQKNEKRVRKAYMIYSIPKKKKSNVCHARRKEEGKGPAYLKK